MKKSYLFVTVFFLVFMTACVCNSDPVQHTGIFQHADQDTVDDYFEALICNETTSMYLSFSQVDNEISCYEIYGYQVLAFYPENANRNMSVCTVKVFTRTMLGGESTKLYKIELVDGKISRIE